MGRTSRTSNRWNADGWWEQACFGRQPMVDLQLRIESGRLTGTGRDIVGMFTLRGTIEQNGRVALVKQYLGGHAVNYVGSYDGEGMMWGQWQIGPLHDRWLIKISRDAPAARLEAEIQTIA